MKHLKPKREGKYSGHGGAMSRNKDRVHGSLKKSPCCDGKTVSNDGGKHPMDFPGRRA